MNERTHFFRKIYLSQFIRKGRERVVYERWVGDWTDWNILIPSFSTFSSTSFSFCWAVQPGVLRAQALCWELLLTASSCNRNSNQLTPTHSNSLWDRVISLTSTFFPWASQFHRFQPIHRSRLYLRYLRPDAPVSWLTAGSKVNMLHKDNETLSSRI